MNEQVKNILLALIKGLSEPEYVTQREYGEPCIKGKNLRLLIDTIKGLQKIMNINKLRKFFCKHLYTKIGFYEELEHGIRHSIRIYKCQKCGKEIHVDGRKDRYAR